MIKRFLWHSKAAQETQQCSLVRCGFQCHLNASSRILRFSQVIQHKAPRSRRGLVMPLSYITTGSHRVDRHILYHRKVPSMSYGASEGLWNTKHNEVQNWNFPCSINITLSFISYHLGLHNYLYRTCYCRFRGYSGILKQNKSGSNVFLGCDFKSLGTLLKTNFTATRFWVSSANKEFTAMETEGITWWSSSCNTEKSLYNAICRILDIKMRFNQHIMA